MRFSVAGETHFLFSVLACGDGKRVFVAVKSLFVLTFGVTKDCPGREQKYSVIGSSTDR